MLVGLQAFLRTVFIIHSTCIRRVVEAMPDSDSPFSEGTWMPRGIDQCVRGSGLHLCTHMSPAVV